MGGRKKGRNHRNNRKEYRTSAKQYQFDASSMPPASMPACRPIGRDATRWRQSAMTSLRWHRQPLVWVKDALFAGALKHGYVLEKLGGRSRARTREIRWVLGFQRSATRLGHPGFGQTPDLGIHRFGSYLQGPLPPRSLQDRDDSRWQQAGAQPSWSSGLLHLEEQVRRRMKFVHVLPYDDQARYNREPMRNCLRLRPIQVSSCLSEMPNP
jgi:hypothetical protein